MQLKNSNLEDCSQAFWCLLGFNRAESTNGCWILNLFRCQQRIVASVYLGMDGYIHIVTRALMLARPCLWCLLQKACRQMNDP